MANNAAARIISQRPPIVGVIASYVILRQKGNEFWGLCPFHAEQTPSFAVNPEKEVFYCHACHEGGDAITFIQKIEGVDFKTAIGRLGLGEYKPSPRQIEIRAEAKRISEWVRALSIKLNTAIRETGDEIRICRLTRKELGTGAAGEVIEREAALIRKWAILCDLDDDLNSPTTVLELWADRASIEHIAELVA
jgi:hypothetical protein